MCAGVWGQLVVPHTVTFRHSHEFVVWPLGIAKCKHESVSDTQTHNKKLDCCRQDEAWLSIQLHCTSKHTAVTSSAEALTPDTRAPLLDDPGAGLLAGALSSPDPSNLRARALPGSLGHPKVLEFGRDRQLPSNQLRHAAQQR